MSGWRALGLLALALTSFATVAGELQLTVRETVSLDFPNASAAFSVDPGTADATLVGTQVLVVGRRAGQTPITIVTPDRVETLTVRVEGAAVRALPFQTPGLDGAGTWESSYDSATGRVGIGVSTTMAFGERTARLQLRGLHERAPRGGRDSSSLPAASLAIEAPGQSIVLLDQRVEGSPLTLDGIVLRGLHAATGRWALHTGIASQSPMDDLVLPQSGDRATSLSYHGNLGSLRIIPVALWLPDSDRSVPGAVTLGIERGGDGDGLQLATELGWSARPAAAINLSWHAPQRHAWLKGATRPEDFAAIAGARPAGGYLDAGWSEQWNSQTTLGIGLSESRLHAAGREPEATAWRVDMRQQMTDRWSLTAGHGGGTYRDGSSWGLSRRMVSIGAAYDATSFGIAAVARQQRISDGGGGSGGRLTLRGAQGPWQTHLFVDAQRDAPTLDLVMRERPALARELEELGISGGTPEDVVRQLRDNPALFARHGVTMGSLQLDAVRWQGGLDLSWRHPPPQRAELGLRLAIDDTPGAFSGRRAGLATLYSSWRLFGDMELTAGYTRWAVQRPGSPVEAAGSFQLTVRTPLSSLARPSIGRRTISGRVLRDAAGDQGLSDAVEQPLDGVEVVLDGTQRTRSDGEGRFAFYAPGPGPHRVEAVLPSEPGAYFASPSAVQLEAGNTASFAISFAAARLAGTVRSDAGVPLVGVTVRLEGATRASTVTDSSGSYRFAGPPGVVTVSLARETVPAGYELASLTPQDRRLAVGEPAVAEFTVAAQRSLEGTVRGHEGGPMTITVLEIHRIVVPDAKTGRFILRGLPAGPLTLLVKGRHGRTCQVVTVPREPGKLAGVELEARAMQPQTEGPASDTCLERSSDETPGKQTP